MSNVLTLPTTPVIPLHPDDDWFLNKPAGLKAEGKKYIGSEETGDYGRLATYIFKFGECLEEGPGECWLAPRTQNDYQFFHNGTAKLASGAEISVGAVGIYGGHPDHNLTAEEANIVYGAVENQRMYGTIQEDPPGTPDGGVYFLGAFTADTTPAEIETVRRSPMSADYRWRNRMPTTKGAKVAGYDFIGFVPVTRPGFPMARAAALMSLVDPGQGAKFTVPYGADFEDMEEDEPCCSTCATKAAAVAVADVAKLANIAPGGSIADLQVGVGGFQGFEDRPIGEQVDTSMMGAGGAAPAPAGPDPMVVELKSQVEALSETVKELEERIEELDQAMTRILIDGAPAPELILNADNQINPEEHDRLDVGLNLEPSGSFGSTSRI